MYDNTPNCAHCQQSQWYEVHGTNATTTRKALRCNLTHREAKTPCRHFLREDLRRHLNPGTAILYDGHILHSLIP